MDRPDDAEDRRVTQYPKTRSATSAIAMLALLAFAAVLLHGCAAAVPAPSEDDASTSAETVETVERSDVADVRVGTVAVETTESEAWPPASTPEPDPNTDPRTEAQTEPRPPRAAHWSEHMKAGRAHLQYDELAEAEDQFTRAFDATADFRQTDPRTLSTLRNLERVARSYQLARDAAGFARVMELLAYASETNPAARTPELAALTHDLATTLAAQGRFEEARAALERTLVLLTEARGSEDAELVGVHAQLGLTLIELDELDAAERELDRAAEIGASSGGPDSPLFAKSLLPRARLLFVRGDVQGARDALRAAIDIHEEHDGPLSPATARVLRELAVFEQNAGDYPAADAAFERVIYVWDALPRESYQRAMSRNELAWFLIETGEAARAEAPARSALGILEERGISGPPLAAICDTLATSLRDQAKYEEAERFYQQALDEGAQNEGGVGLGMTEIVERYAVLLDQTGRGTEAAALRERF